MRLEDVEQDHVVPAVKVDQVATQVLRQQEDVTLHARHDREEPVEGERLYLVNYESTWSEKLS